jgi:hypothetical protein
VEAGTRRQPGKLTSPKSYGRAAHLVGGPLLCSRSRLNKGSFDRTAEEFDGGPVDSSIYGGLRSCVSSQQCVSLRVFSEKQKTAFDER